VIFGAIEAGGTKFVCAVADKNLNVIEQVKFDTETPEKTMGKVFNFFDQFDLNSMGIGSFGPIDVIPSSKTYGYITTTPKPDWAHFDFLGAVKAKYDIPVYWTTDVNASGYGEYQQGKAKDLDSCLYLTVGTGVGGGAIYDGEILIGRNHLEVGHVIVRKHEDDAYAGHCPYHGDCLEGLICGPAIEARFDGKKAKDIEADNPVWDYAAYYLAQALRGLSLTLMPDQIIIGGGVMKQPQLMSKVRAYFDELWADYLPLPDLDEYIVTPKLEDDAGIVGCLLLAEKALRDSLKVTDNVFE